MNKKKYKKHTVEDIQDTEKRDLYERKQGNTEI